MAERCHAHSGVLWALTLLLVAGCGRDASTDVSLSGVRLGEVLGGNIDGFASAASPREFIFPDDHGPHPAYRSEWWYVTAVLKDSQGAEFGLQFTLFRQALAPPADSDVAGPWSDPQGYLAHFALTDVDGDAHYTTSRFSRAHPAAAGVVARPSFRAFIEDWTLIETGRDPWTLALEATEPGSFAARLRFEQTTTVLLQGDEGLSRKGPDAASYYYSLPRLQTRGQITVGGRQVEVSGWAWLDREWSTSVLGPHLQGWDWFALQLQDGRNLMVFRLRRTDGVRDPYDYGVLIGSDGGVHKLSSSDFELRPLRYWRDEQGTAWPVEWDLQAGGEQMRIRALVDDQVVRQGLVYWEGIVGVTGGGQKLGRGYMELTGYSMP